MSETGTTKTGPERRDRRDRRDTLIVTIGAIALIAVVISIVTAVTTLSNRSDLLDQKAGRQIGVTTSCAVSAAVIKGASTLLRGGVLLPGDSLKNGHFTPGKLTTSLGPDYPGYGERIRNAERASARFERSIVASVVAQVKAQDPSAKPPVRNGHLDCRLYARQVAKAK
jgi:hypothetical protein